MSQRSFPPQGRPQQNRPQQNRPQQNRPQQNPQNTVNEATTAQPGNIGYAFNRLLYLTENGEPIELLSEGAIESRVSEGLQALCSVSLRQPQPGQANAATAPLTLPAMKHVCSFTLKTQYPGLLTGLAYGHGIPGSNADTKTGFYFDHTSGLPILPGSSVKGTLRSYWQELPEDTDALLKGTPLEGKRTELFSILFDGVTPEKGEPLPMCQRAIFFDAYPCESVGSLMGLDSITPHKDPLDNPVPIKILKVKGGVTWKFSFRFPVMPPLNEEGSHEALLQVFKALVMDWGIGAKTHVGYGNFSEA